MTLAHLAPHAALCALLGIAARLCLTQHHPHPDRPACGRTAKEHGMTQPTETSPWYGRSAASGETLIVAGRETTWREADTSIPGGWPMVNDGQGWRVDHAAHRTPYSPHPEVQKPPAHRTEHSGAHTKFCVLCLSGKHQRIDATEEPTR